MKSFELKGKEYIQLNQLLKMLALVGSGGEANIRIDNGEVKVNGEVEHRRRNKLRPNDIVQFGKDKIEIIE